MLKDPLLRVAVSYTTVFETEIEDRKDLMKL